MKTAYSYLVLGCLIFLIYGCGVKKSAKTTDLSTQCCKECLEAFSQSPVGVGADGARCGFFNSSAEISSPCQKYFKENQVMVSECQ